MPRLPVRRSRGPCNIHIAGRRRAPVSFPRSCRRPQAAARPARRAGGGGPVALLTAFASVTDPFGFNLLYNKLPGSRRAQAEIITGPLPVSRRASIACETKWHTPDQVCHLRSIQDKSRDYSRRMRSICIGSLSSAAGCSMSTGWRAGCCAARDALPCSTCVIPFRTTVSVRINASSRSESTSIT